MMCVYEITAIQLKDGEHVALKMVWTEIALGPRQRPAQVMEEIVEIVLSA